MQHEQTTASLSLTAEPPSPKLTSFGSLEATWCELEQSRSKTSPTMQPQFEEGPSPLLDHVLQKLGEGAGPGSIGSSSGTGDADSDNASAFELLDVAQLGHSYFEKNFTRVQLLGRGAFGEVWHCKNLEDGRHYAVKLVRYRGGGGGGGSGCGAAGAGREEHVVREAETLALMDHPNVLHFHQAWIERDVPGCTMAEKASGDATSSTRASSWPPTPASTPFAPPPSPAQRLKLPTLLLCDPSSTEGSWFTYDGGSCGSGIVFFEWNEGECNVEEWSRRGEDAKLGTRPSCRSAERQAVLPEDLDPASEYTATLYLQVELCKEDTLQTWIAQRNAQFGDSSRISSSRAWAKKAISILQQCALALAHIHGQSCVHRDVKPSNIFFSLKDNSVRLGDFGLAKVLSGDANRPLCQESPVLDPVWPSRRGSRRTVGTPSYSSPEQLAGQELYTSSDIYSLGLVLAEILCPVKTQMERASVLEGLRHKRQLPATAMVAFPVLAELAVQMTQPSPPERPTAAKILEIVRKAASSSAADLCAAMQINSTTDAVRNHKHHPSRGLQHSAVVGQPQWRRRSQHRKSMCRRLESRAARVKKVKSSPA